MSDRGDSFLSRQPVAGGGGDDRLRRAAGAGGLCADVAGVPTRLSGCD